MRGIRAVKPTLIILGVALLLVLFAEIVLFGNTLAFAIVNTALVTAILSRPVKSKLLLLNAIDCGIERFTPAYACISCADGSVYSKREIYYRRCRKCLSRVEQTLLRRQKFLCGRSRATGGCQELLGPLTNLDHIKPKSAGGRNTMRNLQLLHPACNQQKGNTILEREDIY